MAARAAEEAPPLALRRLLKTDPDRRVRQRAQAVLLVEHRRSLVSVGRLVGDEAGPRAPAVCGGLRRKVARGWRSGRGVVAHRRWMRRHARSWKRRWSTDRTRMACR
jgi:hypothetical protein